MDTRATDSTDKHLDLEKGPQGLRDFDDLDNGDAYLDEKQIAEKQIATVHESESSEQTPISPGATLVADPESPHPKTIDEVVAVGPGSPPEPKVRKICGMRRRNFWVAFGVILATVIAASIIGGVVGGRKKQTAPPQTLSGSTLPPPAISGPLS